MSLRPEAEAPVEADTDGVGGALAHVPWTSPAQGDMPHNGRKSQKPSSACLELNGT
jgi:hypothetical protein